MTTGGSQQARFAPGKAAPATPFELLPLLAAGWRPVFVELPLTLTAEAFNFAGKRLQAQADYIGALGRCTSVSEAAQLQAEFNSRAVSDYQAEGEKVAHDVREAISVKAA